MFVGFFLLHLEAVCMFARFSLTANVSQGILDLVLGFVGMYFAAASRCASTKFSYSSFGVNISVFSCSASNLFLNASTYLPLISLLLRRAQSLCMVVVVRVAFFRRLSRIFSMTIRWSEDTPSKKEYASKFIALFFHFSFIKIWSLCALVLFAYVLVHNFPSLFWKFVLRHVNLFSIMKSVWCCPFLFNVLCMLYLLFPFFPIWAFISPPMTRTLCFGMLRTREDSSS